MFIDTHAHLNFESDYPDLDNIIHRARTAGVCKIINVGSDLGSSKRAVELSSKYGELYATVGLHPTDHIIQAMDIEKLEELAKGMKTIAIGETGLDYFRLEDESEKDKQKELFFKQIDLAEKLNLPLIIHSRNADQDMLDSLKTKKVKKGVMHCFVGDLSFAKSVLDLGLMISFTGIITFPKTEYLAEVVKDVPLEKIMIETDCPFLAPQLYRGKKNEPSYVIEVAKKIAEIKNLSLKKVEEVTANNAIKFFNLV